MIGSRKPGRFRRCGLAALVAAVALASGAQARDRALVVGVNHYPDIIFGHESGGKDLRGAVYDAQTFAKLLVDTQGFDPQDVKLLTDAQASRAAILTDMQTWLADGSGPGDRIVFYYSGHGASEAVPDDAGGKRLTSTIVPADASGDLDQPNATVSGMIEGATIGKILAGMKDRRIMVVADSCHSGSVTRGLGQGPALRVRTLTPRLPLGVSEDEFTPDLRRTMKLGGALLESEIRSAGPEGMAVWSAAAIDQVTFDLPSGKGGIFTQSFAKGLDGREAATTPSGEVTAGALFNYVRDQEKAFCEDQASSCLALTPTLQAAPEYRNLVLNPYKPSSTEAGGPATAQQVAAEAVNLLGHRNDFRLEAAMKPGTRVQLNDEVTFRITSAEPGSLLVLDSGPDGKLRQIFPNTYSEKNHKRGHINGGASITIPDRSYGFAFVATDAGPGTLLVLVAESAVDLSPLVAHTLDLRPRQDGGDLVALLAQILQTPILSPDPNSPNRGPRWSFVAIPYQIER